jgi:hypothetical protein
MAAALFILMLKTSRFNNDFARSTAGAVKRVKSAYVVD